MKRRAESGRKGSAGAAPGALRWIVPAAVAAAAFVAFLPALASPFVNWDDPGLVLQNPHLRGLSAANLRWMFTTFQGGHYMPLTWASYALDFRLWGLRASGYHLTNLLLHAANALLFWLAARRLLRAGGVADGTASRLAAAAAALFFAVHPLRVESVAWVSERKDVLSGFFWLLTLLAYLRMAEERGAGRRWGRWLLLSLAAFLASLLSKAWGITLPAVLLLLDVYPLRRVGPGSAGAAWRRVLAEKVPHAILAGGVAALALLAQGGAGAMKSLAQHGIVARGMQAAWGLCFYLWKTAVPVRLSPLYLLRDDDPLTGPRYAACAAAVVAVTIALVLLRRRAPWLLASWIAYGVVLSPVLGFAQSGSQLAADRYSYLACLPWALLAGAGIGAAWRARPRLRFLALVLPAAAALLLTLGVLTFRQTLVWTSTVRLWEQAVRVDPSNYYAFAELGIARQEGGAPGAGLADCERAVALGPRFPRGYACRGEARRRGADLAGALADYGRALALDPGAAGVWLNRGGTLLQLGDAAGALADSDRAIALGAGGPEAFYNRGVARAMTGDRAGGVADIETALRIAPPGWPMRGWAERQLAALRSQGGGAGPP